NQKYMKKARFSSSSVAAACLMMLALAMLVNRQLANAADYSGSLCRCSPIQATRARIIGGNMNENVRYPWMASLGLFFDKIVPSGKLFNLIYLNIILNTE